MHGTKVNQAAVAVLVIIWIVDELRWDLITPLLATYATGASSAQCIHSGCILTGVVQAKIIIMLGKFSSF
jgi:hypothetical protein